MGEEDGTSESSLATVHPLTSRSEERKVESISARARKGLIDRCKRELTLAQTPIDVLDDEVRGLGNELVPGVDHFDDRSHARDAEVGV
jgi:hypothetical protein